MKIHVIAIGGRVMHTLALALKGKNHFVTGSDDEIYEPSRSRLEKAGLLPDSFGWDESRIKNKIDLIILGMHARKDNPELLKAQELGIPIMSYPEYIYQESKAKKRVVIAGSHGKTTTTAMVMHVLKYRDFDFDFVIGADLEGFGTMVKLTDAPLIIIEGDEYLSSCIDRRSKMVHYKPDISIITGIAWDHVNVFKTEEEYIDLFYKYTDTHESDSKIFVFEEDTLLQKLKTKYQESKDIETYGTLELLENGNIIYDKKQYRIKVFGAHNRANMMAALKVCFELGITTPDFFAAISTFEGADKRMELILETADSKVYRDFAHAPSKVNATVKAVKEHFPNKKIIAFLELHTFSSLNANFLPKYNGSLNSADESYVYYSNHTLKIKKMEALSRAFVKEAFGDEKTTVIDDKNELAKIFKLLRLDNCVVLMMSSGTFDHLDVKGILAKNYK